MNGVSGKNGPVAELDEADEGLLQLLGFRFSIAVFH